MTDVAPRTIANFEDPAPAGSFGASVNGSRPPPHDLEAERALLGDLLALPARIGDALALVAPGDFYLPAHGEVFGVLSELGADLDVAAVAARLADGGRLERVGGQAALLGLLTAGSGAWARHARRVAELGRRRRLVTAARELEEAARVGDESALAKLTAALTTEAGTGDLGSWGRIDLAAVIAGEQLTQAPEILHRDDGQALIYRGKVHAFNAESESGKSWLAMWACVEQLRAGELVVYLDFEDGAGGVSERMLLLGAGVEDLDQRFWYVRPDDPMPAGGLAFLSGLGASLVVVDGVTEAMVTNGWSIIDNDDVARFLATMVRPFARAGAAVVLIDHVVKNKAERGDHGIGGQHKRAGVDGATYKLEVLRPFGRGMDGSARITVTKDRPGHVRLACAGGRTVGELRLASRAKGAVSVVVVAPSSLTDPDAVFRPTMLMERVSRHVEDTNTVGIEPSVRDILRDVMGNKEALRRAVTLLKDEGFVVAHSGSRGAVLHRSERLYRQEDDPASDRWRDDDGGPDENDGLPF